MSRSPEASLSKIIWALDAFESPARLNSAAADVIRGIAARKPLQIEPVYVLSASQLNLPLEFGGPWIEEYRPAAEKALEQIVKQEDLGETLPPHILYQESSATTHSVKTLADYAKRSQAEFIIAGTHGRKGISRLILGSFAESLLLHSSVPVIIVGVRPRRLESFDALLFPTEFGPRSKEIFKRVVDFAKDMGSRVILYHSVPHPIEPVMESGVYLLGGSWIPVSAYFSLEEDRQRRRAEAWAKWAKGRGITVEIEINSEEKSISQSILEVARSRKAGLICMEAQSGSVAATLIGSITRQVIRSADCPVWVLRPAAQPKSQSRLKAA